MSDVTVSCVRTGASSSKMSMSDVTVVYIQGLAAARCP